MRQSYLIIYNAITNYGRAIIQGVIAFLLIPYIISHLSSEKYGIVILATTAYGMIELFGTGLNKAVIKYHAQARAKKHVKVMNLVFNSSLILFLFIGVIGGIVISFLALNFKNIFNVPNYLINQGQNALIITAIVILPCILLDVYKGILSGEQRYDLVNLIGTTAIIIRATLIVIYFTYFSPSVIAVVIIYSFSYLVERFGYLIASYKFINGLKISFRYFSKLGIKIIIGFSSMILIATMANMLATHFFKFIIGVKLSLKDLAYYGVLLVLTTTAALLVRSFVNVLVPVASKYKELRDYHRIKKILLHGSKYSLIIMLSLTLITIPFLKELLRVWMGSEFEKIWSIGVIMFLAQIISSTAITSNQVLSGLGKVKILAFSSSISVFIGLGLSIVYLWFFTKPILFIAVLLISLQRLINSIIINMYGLKILKINVSYFFRQAYLMPLLIGILILVFGSILKFLIPIHGWVRLISIVLFIEGVYFTMIYIFTLNKEEKYLMNSFFQKTFTKIALFVNK